MDDVPAFPYTQTPILPKEVYKPGVTSKVGLHEHEGSPVFVVAKMPRHKKLRPGKEDDGVRWLRTTRVLGNGKWELESRMRNRTVPSITYSVDRAVFLFKKAGQATANDTAQATKHATVQEPGDTTFKKRESLKFDKWVYKEAEGTLVR